MNRSALKEEIIREIRQENQKVIGMTAEHISNVVEFQFQFVRKVIEAGEYEGVRLPYLGKFYTKVERIKALTDGTFRRKREQSNHQPGV
jgi:hypothetical protein